MRRCIFHYPEPVTKNPTAGSALRPNRMLQAFQNIGYEVDEVTGYSSERCEKIKEIRKRINEGTVYDFVYSESVNSPTLMTDADHIPRHPLMDFRFFNYCRKAGIPVALFYRDMQWKFSDIFNAAAPFWKRMILIPMYYYDLFQYSRSLDLLYLPTVQMKKYVKPDLPYKSLPPAGSIHEDSLMVKRDRSPLCDHKLRIFYVGGMSNLYDNRKLIQAVKDTEDVFLTICTHMDQWQKFQNNYGTNLCDRIRIISKSSDELKPFYEESDIAACCMDDNPYLDIAMPIKCMEAVSYGTPLLVTRMEAVSDFVKVNQIGWSVDTTSEAIRLQLEYLKEHPEEIREKTKNTIAAAYHNTWEDRARQAAEDLTKEKR